MSESEFVSEFRVLETGSSFISKNSKDFSDKYPKKFIAVHGDKLIAVDENFDKVMIAIEEKGLNPSFVLIEYVPSKDEIVLY